MRFGGYANALRTLGWRFTGAPRSEKAQQKTEQLPAICPASSCRSFNPLPTTGPHPPDRPYSQCLHVFRRTLNSLSAGRVIVSTVKLLTCAVTTWPWLIQVRNVPRSLCFVVISNMYMSTQNIHIYIYTYRNKHVWI